MGKWRLILLLLCVYCGSGALAAELLNPGDAVPEFPAAAEWYAGGPQKIGDFGTAKALVLYFAKPGCASCDEFAPHLYRLLLKNPEKLRVVMVAPGMYPGSDIAEYVAKRTLGDYPVMRDADNSFAPRFIGKVDKFPYVAIIAAAADAAQPARLAWYGRAKFHEQITAEVDRALGKNTSLTAQNPPAQGQTPAAAPHKTGLLSGAPEILIVGAEKTHASAAPLLSPARDSAAIAEILQKKGNKPMLLTTADGQAVTAAAFTAAWDKLLTAPVSAQDGGQENSSPRKFILFYSGDAAAAPLDTGKTDLQFRLADGTVTLSSLVQKVPAGAELTVIADAMHADRFQGLSAKDADNYLFADIIKEVGAAFPQATILLSSARWDMSLLADETAGGTLFAKILGEELSKENVPAADELWRTLRDRLAHYGRQTGKLQSPGLAAAHNQ